MRLRVFTFYLFQQLAVVDEKSPNRQPKPKERLSPLSAPKELHKPLEPLISSGLTRGDDARPITSHGKRKDTKGNKKGKSSPVEASITGPGPPKIPLGPLEPIKPLQPVFPPPRMSGSGSPGQHGSSLSRLGPPLGQLGLQPLKGLCAVFTSFCH